MDSIDMNILELLQQNARQEASAISDGVHLSVSAVIERIRKMEKEGIIKNFTVTLDTKKLGYDITAYVGVTLEHPNFYNGFIEVIREMPSVISCSYITGDFDFMLKVMTDTTDGLEKIHREIKTIQGVMSIKTFFVLSSVKDNINLPKNVFENRQ